MQVKLVMNLPNFDTRKQEKWKTCKVFIIVVWSFFMALVFVSAERKSKLEFFPQNHEIRNISNFITVFADSVLQATKSSYQDLKLSWQVIGGSIVGFLGAAFGGVGGAGGGGIYVPMLTLIVGFDLKSAIAISNCMITGAAITTATYNLKLGKIDYDLALVIQPMLLLGISIGVNLNLIFADWMIALLLTTIFLVTSTKAFFKGTVTSINESLLNQELVNRLKPSASGNTNKYEAEDPCEVCVVENVCRKEFGVVVFIWIAFLAVQIPKVFLIRYLTSCSATYWAVNFLEIGVALTLCKEGGDGVNLKKMEQMISCCLYGVVAGVVGGLLGLGGGFIVAPLFFHLGRPSQVSRATSSFAIIFSSSLSVLEYCLLKRLPLPYAVYFCAIATIGALTGQHVVRKLVVASSIIFLLAFTIFVSALSLGGVATSKVIGKIQRNEYMGFENLCKYQV